jgi:hypothetical protein
MRTFVLTLAFMLIGSFAFANTSFDNFETKTKENSFEESTYELSVNNDENGCWVYLNFIDSRTGQVVHRQRYWDPNCTIVGGRAKNILIFD